MSKRFILTSITILGLGLLLLWAVPLATNWFQYRQAGKAITNSDISRKMAEIGESAQVTQASVERLDMKQTVRLAIGWIGLSDEEQNRRASDLTLTQLGGTPGLEMVDRQSFDVVLGELNLSASGLVRAKDAVRVGKLLRADWFLLGSSMSLNGTNFIVVRIVDARTGIMRDARVFDREQALPQIATHLSNFVRQCRQDAAVARTRVYLAIGAFEDLSVNNRQANFATELRGYLTAAYRGGNVTLLEREYVDTLLKEVRLDLAGLTEEVATNVSQPMQSAFWLLTGQYQSYETTNLQVELNLNVQRIFGTINHFRLRSLPGGPVGEQVKQTIDHLINQNAGVVAPTRVSEIRAQMAIGKELVTKDHSWFDLVWMQSYGEHSAPEMALRRRNTEEAIRAFETVLILDPGNREAKMYLAVCFRRAFIGRIIEARDYYREILETREQDQWTTLAQRALVETFQWSSSQEKANWFTSAIQLSTNSATAEFYRQQSTTASNNLVIESGVGKKAVELAQKRLLDRIRSNRDYIKNNSGSYDPSYGMGDFAEAFSNDETEAARRLVEFLPQMKAEFPEMIPYLLASVVASQPDTNGTVVAEFEQVLDDCIKTPLRVFKVEQFWQEIRWSVYDWCFEKTNYPLAVKLMEGERRAAAEGHAADFNDQEKIKLAYAYMATEQWKLALDAFDSFSNKLVRAEGGGPWGKAFVPILTGKMADHCRDKLGQATVRDSREFDIGPNLVCMHTASEFACDADGLWVAIAGQLIRLDFDFKTNMVVKLPIDLNTPISCLSVGGKKIWIGTGGEGLVEFDKASRNCRRFTEADGLMMDYLTSLQASGELLWIGYGGTTGGGLGQLDIRTQKFKSFMPSLNSLGGEAPPRQPIKNITTRGDGDLWILSSHKIQKFHVLRDSWETLPNKAGYYVTSFSVDADRLIEGIDQGGLIGSKSGLEVLTFSNKKWQSFVDTDGLPNSPTTMSLYGQELWLGGEGFITLVNLKDLKVRKFCPIRARSVDSIQVGGGYLWAQFDKHLHRAVMRELQ